MPSISKYLVLALSLLTCGLTTACHPSSKIVRHVRVKLSENLENITVALVFNQEKIRPSLMGNMELKDYGNIFVTPYTAQPATPFEMGFTLNAEIIRDQEYASLTGTKTLPNGHPLDLPNPVVQIHHAEAVEKDVELYGYVDMTEAKWIGAAAILSRAQSMQFPAMDSHKLVFMRDSDSRPALFSRLSGPKYDNQGYLTHPAGVSLFVNIKSILAEMAGGTETTFRAEARPLHRR